MPTQALGVVVAGLRSYQIQNNPGEPFQQGEKLETASQVRARWGDAEVVHGSANRGREPSIYYQDSHPG